MWNVPVICARKNADRKVKNHTKLQLYKVRTSHPIHNTSQLTILKERSFIAITYYTNQFRYTVMFYHQILFSTCTRSH